MLISPPLQHRGGDDDLPLSQGRRRVLATSWPPLKGKARDKRSRAAGCSKTPRLSRLGDGGQRHSPFSGARPIQKKGAPSPLTMRRGCMRASWPSETVQVPPTPAAHTALKAGTLSTWGMGACSGYSLLVPRARPFLRQVRIVRCTGHAPRRNRTPGLGPRTLALGRPASPRFRIHTVVLVVMNGAPYNAASWPAAENRRPAGGGARGTSMGGLHVTATLDPRHTWNVIYNARAEQRD